MSDVSEHVPAMREWIHDSFDIYRDWTDDETIIRFVANRYEGGVAQFILDGPDGHTVLVEFAHGIQEQDA